MTRARRSAARSRRGRRGRRISSPSCRAFCRRGVASTRRISPPRGRGYLLVTLRAVCTRADRPAGGAGEPGGMSPPLDKGGLRKWNSALELNGWRRPSTSSDPLMRISGCWSRSLPAGGEPRRRDRHLRRAGERHALREKAVQALLTPQARGENISDQHVRYVIGLVRPVRPSASAS